MCIACRCDRRGKTGRAARAACQMAQRLFCPWTLSSLQLQTRCAQVASALSRSSLAAGRVVHKVVSGLLQTRSFCRQQLH